MRSEDLYSCYVQTGGDAAVTIPTVKLPHRSLKWIVEHEWVRILKETYDLLQNIILVLSS
jgi:hypothetical protein